VVDNINNQNKNNLSGKSQAYNFVFQPKMLQCLKI